MAKFRKVDPRIWNDAKFRCLSDKSKLVFFLLLTHPHMTSVGAMRHTVQGMAAELGWDEKGFAEPFREALGKGLVKYDERASFVWLPNFIKYNQPDNPNVVKAWNSALDMLPECDMLSQLIRHVNDFLKQFPEGFRKPFRKSLANQEQEQEQEHKKEKPLAWNRGDDPGSKPSTRIKPNSAGWEGISEQDRDTWSRAYPAVDIDLELSKAFSWFMANPQKTKRNWHRFLTNWLARCQERGGSCKTGSRKANPPQVTQEYQPCPYRDISQDIDPEEAKAYEEKYNTWS